MHGTLGEKRRQRRRMGLRKKEGEAAWRPIALLWARSNLMEDKGRLHTHLPLAYLLPTTSFLPAHSQHAPLTLC